MAVVVSLTKDKILSLIPSMEEMKEWLEDNIEIVDPGQFEDLKLLLDQTRIEIAEAGAERDLRLHEAEAELEAAELRLAAAETRLTEAEAEIGQASDWITESGEELKTRLADAEAEVVAAKGRLADAEGRLADAETEIAAASSWIDVTGAQLGTNLAQAQQDIDAAEVRLGTAETRLSNAEGEIAAASSWIDVTGAQLGTNLAAAQNMLDAAFPTGAFDVDAAIDAAVATGGGNVTTYSNIAEANKPGDAPTSTVGRKSGDIHRNRNSVTGEVYAEWMLGASGTWQSANFGDSILRSLDVGKITGGSASFVDFVSQNLTSNQAIVNDLWTKVVRSQKITTDMLLVGSGVNLVPNGNIALGLEGWSDNWTLNTVNAKSIGYPGSIWLEGTQIGQGEWFPVEGGKDYRVTVWVRSDRAGKTFTMQLLHDGVGAVYPFSATPTMNGAYQEHVASVTMPADATTARVQVYANHGSGSTTDGFQWFTGFHMTEDIASLIVDGGITAKQITITGDENNPDEAGLVANIASIMNLDVENLIVTGTSTLKEAVVNKLWTDVVRSRKITTDMLIVGQGDSLMPDLTSPDAWGLGADVTIAPATHVNFKGTHWLKFNNPSVWQSAASKVDYRVTPGDELLFRWRVRKGVASGQASPRLVFNDSAGNLVQRLFMTPVNALDWGVSPIEITATVPENAATMLVEIVVSAGTAGDPPVYIGDFSLLRKAGASLIVDGAITAKKITITGDENNPDEAGLVANIASIMNLDVENLTATGTSTLETAVIENLWTNVVRARKITADMLVVGSGVNLVVDPGFSNGELCTYRGSLSTGSWSAIIPSPYGGTNRFRLNNSSTGVNALELRQDTSGGFSPIDPDQVYRFRFRAVQHSSGSARARTAVRFRRADGTLGYVGAGAYEPVETDLTKIATAWHEGTWTAPPDAVEAAMTIQVDGEASFVDVVSPSFTVSGSSLIVDGTISSQHINVTGELTARIADIIDLNVERLVVTDNATFKGAVINKIWSDVILARKITADQLLIGNGVNVIPNGNLAIGTEGWTRGVNPGMNTTNAKDIGYPASIWIEGPGNIKSVDFDVEGGKTYRYSMYARSDRTGKRFYVQMSTNGGSSPYLISNEVLPTGWTRYEGTFEAPADATTAFVNIYANHSNGSTQAGYQWFTGFHMTEDIPSLIVDGTIAARHIKALSITGEKIAALTIDANNIKAGAITTAKLQATAIDGMTITGAHIRTSAAPWSGGGIRMLGSRFTMWDSKNRQRVDFNPDTDDFIFTGVLQATNTSGHGIEVRPPTTVYGGWLDFVDPTMSQAAYIATGGTSAVSTPRGTLTMVSAATTTNQRRARLRLEPNGGIFLGAVPSGTASAERQYLNMDPDKHIQFFNDDVGCGIQMGSAGSTGVQIRAGGNHQLWVQENLIVARGVYNNASGGTANVRITSDAGGTLMRISSLSRFKLDQQPIDRSAAVQAFSEIEPVTWMDKYDVDRGHMTTRHMGFIAEQVEAVEKKYNLVGLSVHNDDGELESVAYDRLIALAVHAIRDLNERVRELEER